VLLVHQEGRHRQRLEHSLERRGGEPLRRDVEQLQRAGTRGVERGARASTDRSECSAADRMPRRVRSSTTLHQRDERRHHDS
jgi:hypothetical protein